MSVLWQEVMKGRLAGSVGLFFSKGMDASLFLAHVEGQEHHDNRHTGFRNRKIWLGVSSLLALGQQLLRHESILPVPQNEGEEGEDESVQDAHDRQDVGPTH